MRNDRTAGSIPHCIWNWRLHDEQNPSPFISELYIYSDVHVVAEAHQIGPYAFLNALAFGAGSSDNRLKPAIALRFQHCIPNQNTDMSVSNFTHYHGGTAYDEIAAIVALELGCRAEAGPVVREFRPGEDPLGKPQQLYFDRVPELPGRTSAPQIANLAGQRNLRDLLKIKRLRALSDKNAVAFIKAARLYQQAVWISDSNPELSWLLFVSAVEAAASTDKASVNPIEGLTTFYPKIAEALDTDEQRATVASELSGLFGATRKFCDFLVRHAPGPPERRPEWSQFNFDKAMIKKAARTIYQYRSNALHSGVPFPAPMCQAPYNHSENNVPDEVPSGLAAYTKGATWLAKDLPCHLHIFEYLVRHCLLNWLDKLVKPPSPA